MSIPVAMRGLLPAILALSAAASPEQPILFVENHGQADARVDAVARTRSGHVFLTREGAVLAVGGPDGGGAAVRIRVPGGAPSCVELLDETRARVSVFRGPDPTRWQRGLRTHARARQAEVYPGIDLVYRGHEGALEYDFVVAPHADPRVIRVAFDGAEALEPQADGSVRVETSGGAVLQRAPVAWQVVDGARRDVRVRQHVDGQGEVAFVLGAYDPSRELVIDPLVYSTFLGGSGQDRTFDVVTSPDGTAWTASWTQSPDFPTTFGVYDRSLEGRDDVAVSKIGPRGDLMWSTYLGGESGKLNLATTGWDLGIGVDAAENVFVTADTGPGFPTTAGAYDTTFNSSSQSHTDAFVARLDPSGTTLLFGTYLGGRRIENAKGLVVDGEGRPLIVGRTTSDDFPTTHGVHDGTLGGSQDLFLTKLTADGSALVFSTFLGGSNIEQILEPGGYVALDAAGYIHVTGTTWSSDYPVTPGAFDPTYAAHYDAVVTKLTPDASTLVYSTYLGGRGDDQGHSIAVDAAGSAYVTGYTGSRDFPVTPGSHDDHPRNRGHHAFVTKFSPDGSTLVYSTRVSGTRGVSYAHDIALTAAGEATISGETGDRGFPVTDDAFDRTLDGEGRDAFFSMLSADGSRLVYSTFLGGTDGDTAYAHALEGSRRACIVGYTESLDFPLAGALDSRFGGPEEGFATLLDF